MFLSRASDSKSRRSDSPDPKSLFRDCISVGQPRSLGDKRPDFLPPSRSASWLRDKDIKGAGHFGQHALGYSKRHSASADPSVGAREARVSNRCGPFPCNWVLMPRPEADINKTQRTARKPQKSINQMRPKQHQRASLEGSQLRQLRSPRRRQTLAPPTIDLGLRNRRRTTSRSGRDDALPCRCPHAPCRQSSTTSPCIPA